MRKTYRRNRKSLKRKSHRRSGAGLSYSKPGRQDMVAIASIAASAAAGAAVAALLGPNPPKGTFKYKPAPPMTEELAEELRKKWAIRKHNTNNNYNSNNNENNNND